MLINRELKLAAKFPFLVLSVTNVIANVAAQISPSQILVAASYPQKFDQLKNQY